MLWGYGSDDRGGRRGREGEGYEEIARVYEEMITELREVGRDVEKLKGR